MSDAASTGGSPFSFRECVRADLAHFAEREFKTVTLRLALRMIFLMPGFQFVLARRVQDLLYRVPVAGRALGRICWWWTCRSFGSELAIAAEVGKGLYVPHPYGIVVGVCRIGCGVTILQNVTIGRRANGTPGDPVISDGVYLAAGAVILGNVVLGENSTVGANSVVTKDVPGGAVAVGAPARIVGKGTPQSAPLPEAVSSSSGAA